MALGFVQEKLAATTSSVASLGATFGSNTTTGNFILVCVFSSDSSATNVSSISDTTGGDTYTRITGSNNQGLGMEMWSAKNIVGGTTPTVTVNFTTNCRPVIVIREYSGVDTTNPIDKSNSGNNSSSTTPVSSAITTTSANEIIVGFANVEVDPDTWSLGSGYANLSTSTSGNITGTVGVEDKVVAAIGTYTADFSVTTGGSWEAAIVSLRGATQPTTTSTSSSTSASTSTSSTSTSISTSSTSTSHSTSTSSTSTSFSTSSTSTSTSVSTSTSFSTSSTSTSLTTSFTTSTSSTSTSHSTTTSSTSTSISTSSTSTSTSHSTSSTSTSTSHSTSMSFSTSSTSISTSSTTTLIDIARPLGRIYPQPLTATALDGFPVVLVDDPNYLVNDTRALTGSQTQASRDIRLNTRPNKPQGNIYPSR